MKITKKKRKKKSYLHKPNILKYCELFKEWLLFIFLFIEALSKFGLFTLYNVRIWFLSQSMSCDLDLRPAWLLLLKIKISAKKYLQSFSETAWPIAFKFMWNDPWMVPFPNYVWWSRPPTSIAAVSKNWKFSQKILQKSVLWNCSAKCTQTLVEWSLNGPLPKVCLVVMTSIELNANIGFWHIGRLEITNAARCDEFWSNMFIVYKLYHQRTKIVTYQKI